MGRAVGDDFLANGAGRANGARRAPSQVANDTGVPYLSVGRGAVPPMPTQAGDGRPDPGIAFDVWSGDGQGVRQQMPYRADFKGNGYAEQETLPTAASFVAGRQSMPTPSAEVWKLVTLVIFFVLWISAASAVLFLYMDRYLFPG